MCRSGTRFGGAGPRAAMAAPGGAGEGRSVPPLAAPGAASRRCPGQGPHHREARGRRALCRGGCWDAGGRSGGSRPGGGSGRGLRWAPGRGRVPRGGGASAPTALQGLPRAGHGLGPASRRRLQGSLCSRCVGTGEVHRGRSRGTPRSGRFAHTLICF